MITEHAGKFEMMLGQQGLFMSVSQLDVPHSFDSHGMGKSEPVLMLSRLQQTTSQTTLMRTASPTWVTLLAEPVAQCKGMC